MMISRIDGRELEKLQIATYGFSMMMNSQNIPKSYTYASEQGHDRVIDSHGNTGNLSELRRLASEGKLASQDKDSRYKFA